MLAGYAPVEAAVAERAGLRAKEPHGLPGLGEEVEALILRYTHASLMPVPELIVLPDLNIIRSAISVPQPAADNEVEAPPVVERPEQTQHLV